MASKSRIPGRFFRFFFGGVGEGAGIDRFFGVAAARLGALIRMASRARNSLSHGAWDLLGFLMNFGGWIPWKIAMFYCRWGVCGLIEG